MSASKDKLQRKQQIEAGTDKRTIAQAKEKAQRRKSAITYSVVAVVLVIFFAFIFIYNSSLPVRNTTAVTINGEQYSVAQLNYYYASSYLNFRSSYGDYISYLFDPNSSLADQQYSEDMSWRDYFLDSAVQDMAQIKMLNDEAEAAGFTLSEEQQQTLDAQLNDLETAWEGLGYTNLKQYLNMNFGKGVDQQLVEQEMTRTFIASAYSQSVYDGFEYSATDLSDYYAEHADELDVIDYAYYMVTKPVETEEPAEDEEAADTEEPAEEAETEETADTEDAAEAEETAEAEEMEEPEEPALDVQAAAEELDGTDEDAFADYLAENVGEDTAPTSLSQAGGNISADYSEWLLDEAREPGDAAAIETDTADYVVMFLGRDTNDYPTVSFRHILAMAEDGDGDGELSDGEKQAAEDEARELYEQWQDGDATEDSFAELANANSDDTGSNTNGGLYEDVYKGAMVEPINDWLFAKGRKAGDTEVVSYDGANYTGTHVLYFVGEDDMTYADAQADNALRSEAYNAWIEEHMADYEPVTSHLSMAGKIH